MNLKVLLPDHVLLNEKVGKIVAEAENGSFCLLPRHVDFVAALVPGILSFISDDGEEKFIAVDEGVLVKCGAVVTVSTGNAVMGESLGQLREAVNKQFRVIDERERTAYIAMTRLEAHFVRRFIELKELRRD